ncbi:hypothetical protein AAVH_01188 [Aphelenchoides avenae]|nr:hypothetical protein AAVH_01188 [Aphelenchus avenae]
MASVETKTSTSSAASELPTWYESEAAAMVDISDWEHGSGHSAWSNVAESELWQSILAKASEVSVDLELPVVGAVDGDDWEGSHESSAWDDPDVIIALMAGSSYSAWSKADSTDFGKNNVGTDKASLNKPYNTAPGKFKDTEPKSTVAGSSRLKSAFSTFGKNAFGNNTDFWKETSVTKRFQPQNVAPEPTHDFGSNKDLWSETSDTEDFQSEDAALEPSTRGPLIAAFIVPGSKAFKVLQELGTDEFKLYETVNTIGQKKPAHAIEQEQWS